MSHLRGSKPVLLLSLLLWSCCLAAQVSHIVPIHHTYFTAYFSKIWHIPVMVEYKLTADMVQCDDKTDRKSNFRSDPLLPAETTLAKDYAKPYDCGHNMSAADNACDETGMAECFYFSNITPQPHPFNNGCWKKLETKEREWAVTYGELHIFVGSLDPLYKRIGKDKVSVPRYMYKVIYIPSTRKYACYIFPNSDTAGKTFEPYLTPMKAFVKSSGVRFVDGKAVADFIAAE